MLKENNHILLTLIVLLDLLILCALYLASRFIVIGSIHPASFSIREIIVTASIILILYIALERFEYSTNYRFRPTNRIIKDMIYFYLVMLALFSFSNLFSLYEYSQMLVIIYTASAFTIFFIERIFIKISLIILRRRGYNFRRYLIVGAGKLGLNFYRKIVSSPELGLKIIGFLDDNTQILTSTDPEYTDSVKGLILGPTDSIEMILNTHLIDTVIIALPVHAEKKIVRIANICEKYAIKAELLPDYFKVTTSHPSIRSIKGFPLIGIREVPLENLFNRFLKRLFDFGLAMAGLTVLLPVFAIVAIGIKLTSRGPVFFKQKRTGYNQKEFNIIKFRTMKINKEADKIQASEFDPRKTAFGDFLRRMNIDELPQLLNVIKGEMSLVGPRPHMLAHTEEFYHKYEKYLVRHWVKPGITGWAQVNGWRGDSDIGMRVKYDIYYIENWSFILDLKIVFLTVFGRNVRKHAY